MDAKIARSGTPGNFNEELSLGEKLILWRKRLGWNQIEAANFYKVSLFNYKLAEYDRPRDFKYRAFKCILTPYEKCLIYRKRAKRSQSEISKELGYCRTWIRMMENGEADCTALLDFWENGG